MGCIVAIDFGLANAAVAEGNTYTTYRIKTTNSKENIWDRIEYVTNTILGILVQHEPTTIVIEKPFIARRAKKHLEKTLYSYAVLRARLHEIFADIVVDVPPRDWMRWVDTQTKNRKTWAKRKGYDITSTSKADDHTTDAACMVEWYKEKQGSCDETN